MKKIVFVIFCLFVIVLSNTFGQTTASEWLKKGDEYFQKKDYNNAIKAYTEVIKRDSSNLNAYVSRGNSYSQIKNYDAAIADFNFIANEIPDFPNIYMIRGYTYGEKGVYSKTLADYKKGLYLGYNINDFNVDKSSKSDMWFCATIYMEELFYRFLGNSDSATKLETILKIVCDKNNVSRAEVETFYRDNIRGVISEIVNEEFNKISFSLERGSVVSLTYNFVLTRNPQNGKYDLVYKNIYNEARSIIGNSFDELIRELRSGKYKSDFSQEMIDEIRSLSPVVPALVYTEWKKKNIAAGIDALAIITETLTNFCLEPTRTNYEKVIGIYSRYLLMSFENNDLFAQIASNSYISTVRALNDDLANKANADLATRQQRVNGSAVFGSDERYNIFSTPFK
jgi:tetratricopeptide (TPR) repeat protein